MNYLCSRLERCRSGRSGRTRNAVNGQLFPGFESLSFRNQGSMVYKAVLPFGFIQVCV